MEKENRYLKLSRKDVSEGIEVKHGGLSYLKWSVAWNKLCEDYPDTTYYFGEPMTLPDGTMMVKAGVTVEGLTHEMHLPVLDHRNKPISGPNAFDYNSAQMRCLVKAIAMHGVGIGLYLGDLKHLVEETDFEKAKGFIDHGDFMGLHEFISSIDEQRQIELFNGAPPGTKTEFKNAHRAALKQANDLLDEVANAIGEAVTQSDDSLLNETIDELSKYERHAILGRLSAEEINYIKTARSA